MVVAARVEVRGLRELSGAFRQIDVNLQRQLKTELMAVAQMVAGRAAAKVPKVSGAAAASITPRSSVRGAGIAFGGTRAPYYPWLDFGGRVGRRKSIYRDMIQGGRYVYPAIGESRDDIEEGVEEAVNKAAKAAGFETRIGV